MFYIESFYGDGSPVLGTAQNFILACKNPKRTKVYAQLKREGIRDNRIASFSLVHDQKTIETWRNPACRK